MKDVTLTKEQEEAKNLICDWFLHSDCQVFVLGGYAGTGKTFLVNHVVTKVLNLAAGVEAAFVSPTGKAASVLIQQGTVATTVHGLIYTIEKEEMVLNEQGEVVSRGQLIFRRREGIDSKIKLIVIDETSMINEEMLADLLSFKVKCLFCGDDAQLPPVNGVCPLLATPSFTLKEIVRQAKDNPIVHIATMAREGRTIPYGTYGDKVVVLPKYRLSGAERKRLMLKADQIICGTNKTRFELNREMREYLGVQPTEDMPIDGEKLICTYNNWEKALDNEEKFHLVNGIIGVGRDFKEGIDGLCMMDFTPDFLNESVRVPFDTAIFTDGAYLHGYNERAVILEDGTAVHEMNKAVLRRVKAVSDEPICRFEFAYAITCHKAQGSEFNFVIVFDESWAFREEKNKWLYTAITRAKDKLLIVR